MPSRGQHWKIGGLVDGTVTGADIKNATIEAVDIGLFVSAEQVGTGSAQNIAHGLGATPSKSFLSVYNFGANVAVDVVEGTHTSTNCVVTATSGVKYKILAIV